MGPGIPLNRFNSLHTACPEEIHRHMQSQLREHKLSFDGHDVHVNFCHNKFELIASSINAIDYGLSHGRTIIDIPPSEGAYLLQISLSGSAELRLKEQAFAIDPSCIFICGPDEEIHQQLSHDYQHISVKIERTLLETLLRQEVQAGSSPLQFRPEPLPITAGTMALTSLIQSICTTLDTDADSYEARQSRRAMDCAIAQLLLCTVPHNYSVAYHGNHSFVAPYYVRRAEEYIRTNLADCISLENLVEICGISGRSLYNGFKRFRDTTPMRFLKDRRLEAAHQRLRIMDPTFESVTEIALDCGFTHLSRFAQDYKQMFGELPSETAKKM